MRVLILEDDALLREGLVLLLESDGIEVAGAVANVPEFLALLERERPDAAVTDVRLPPTFTDEGIRAALEARRLIPGLPVLVLSAYVDEGFAADLLGQGPDGIGYLLKERVSRVDEFLGALHRVAGGGTAIDPEVVSRLLVRRKQDDPLRALTPREREILGLMAEGRDNAGIAGALFVTETAVSKHISGIFAKLGLTPEVTGHRRVLAVLAHLDAAALRLSTET
ncbi:DNA-binding response regulator [Amycolatopsis antarctica]|uniref:DNA-binding response regulator n=1 Tax=Amycolatopsis antarctica TaxID=1854586 RepID=A0A263D518_9PSEU|nr:response regulator transcription factor [Amycolatopsis antarctica]OZM73592.1 DNA-binding response regulator [Amycolatopsis antarctica]